MNARPVAAVLFIMLSLLFLATSPIHAMNITLGVNAYYAVWDPAWRNVNGYFESDPLLMWGPSATFSFEGGWYMSLIYLQNRTNPADARYTVNGSGSGNAYTMIIDTTIERGELEFTAGYRLFDSIRVFAGLKNMFYYEGGGPGKSNASISITSPYTVGAIDALYADSYGVGSGLMYFTRVLDNTVFSVSASFIYMRATVQTNEHSEIGTTRVIVSHSDNYQYNAVGGSTGINLSYYFPGAGVSLTLGGRFQLLKYIPVADALAIDDDIYYGLMAAAGYTF